MQAEAVARQYNAQAASNLLSQGPRHGLAPQSLAHKEFQTSWYQLPHNNVPQHPMAVKADQATGITANQDRQFGQAEGRRKRSLADTVVGMYISDVWSTVRDAIWTNLQVQAAKDRQMNMETELTALRQKNITHLAQDALSRAVEINADLVETNHAEWNRIISSHPILMVVVSDAVCRIHRMIDLIDRIKSSFKHKTPDLVSITQLLEENSQGIHFGRNIKSFDSREAIAKIHRLRTL